MIKIERGKRVKTKPIDDSATIYISSAHEKYSQLIGGFRKHPYKIVEYYTGEKLSLWQKIYFDIIGKLHKTEHEKKWKAINKVIKPYIRKK